MIRAILVALIFAASLGSAYAQSTPDASDDPAVREAATEPSASATPFPWPSFDEATEAARSSGKPILIDIYAPWCGWCRKMQAEVYTNEALQAYLNEHFEYGRLNIDDSDTRHQFAGYEVTSQELGYGLGAEGTPTTVFLEWQDGQVKYITRLPGYADLASFTNVLRYIGTDAYQNQSFEEFLEAQAAEQ